MILPQRSAERGAPRLSFIQWPLTGGRPNHIGVRVLLIRVVAIDATVKGVRATARHHVDGGAGESALSHVVRRNVDRYLFGGFQREWVEERLQARCVEPELIVDPRTVEHD